MSTEQLTIKTAYETLKMSPQEIADDRQLDVTAVKASLAATSSQYRKDCAIIPEAELDFTDQDLKDVNEIILDIAKNASIGEDGMPDYRTRLTAATYIRDDKKGRKNLQKALGGNNFNILNFNESLAKLRETKESILQNLSNGNGQQITNV